MKNKKNIIILAVIALLGVGIFLTTISSSYSRTKPYYSGEVVSFNGKIFIGSVNTGNLELFTLENDKLFKKKVIVPDDLKYTTFYDLQFYENNHNLYVYLTNGRYVYKYLISNPINPQLVKKIKDNSWDWFLKLDMIEDSLVTIGTKGIKIWNSDYQVVNEYKLTDIKNYQNISFSKQGGWTFNIAGDKLEIYNTNNRELLKNINLNVKQDSIRKIFNDNINNLIYAVDDSALTAFNFNGDIIKQFKHISASGYDVAQSEDFNYLYFSDGIGVVKMSKSDLKPVDWIYTTNLGIANSWAMGLKTTVDSKGEKVIIFNNSNILVLDDQLEVVDYYKAEEKDYSPKEALYLGVDRNRAISGSLVALRGGGFGLNESLTITFADKKIIAKTDENGRFVKILTVPYVAPIRTDIKVVGEQSGLSYSVGFEVE
ncbi:MAG: hypothetical protein V1768_03465 [Patescibacteria group bacterium]|nr:hypothetical protein [Patescibacteria group bacterium]MBU1160799.1 hypothetical protein [Patescibacteria group bacterium]MBU1684377.1 hypothetical protein [Patescibacteria group bacterium]MBU1987489.1 hypothetical protein [Patescibacteria group bacterium]MBU2415659.1 hypothetical protein [Patescibacteria group bacterium]